MRLWFIEWLLTFADIRALFYFVWLVMDRRHKQRGLLKCLSLLKCVEVDFAPHSFRGLLSGNWVFPILRIRTYYAIVYFQCFFAGFHFFFSSLVKSNLCHSARSNLNSKFRDAIIIIAISNLLYLNLIWCGLIYIWRKVNVIRESYYVTGYRFKYI